MKILIAKTAGFCMGVRRAVELVLDSPLQHEGPIYTYGPLIHNPQVLGLLKEKGISVLRHIPDQGQGTVLIRAHGVPPEAKTALQNAGFNVVDATCPRVIKVQTIIRKHAQKGYAAIIIGDRNHPEVVGLLGYARGSGQVVNTMEAMEALPSYDNAIIVAQTTQNTSFFDRVKQWAERSHPHYKVFDTICDSTSRRQAEIKRLAGSVDKVIVVGGRDSGNTQRLVEIADASGTPAYHIETEADLSGIDLGPARLIGITAGASTPNWIIRKVYRTLETLPLQKGSSWRKVLLAVQHFLLLTNLYVSLGAGCLAFACASLLNLGSVWPSVIIACLYVHSMHTLNHLRGSEEDRYNDPERAVFYQKYRIPLTLLAVISGGSGLITAYMAGRLAFWVLFIMSILGLSYNLRLLQVRISGKVYRCIKDIPGSKTVLIALAWGVATAVFPSLAAGAQLTPASVLLFVWTAGLVFARTAFFDILDMQGDRIVGKETIPILIGERRTLRYLRALLTGLIVLMCLPSLIGGFPYMGLGLALCPAFLLLVLTAHVHGFMVPGIRLDSLVETPFVLAGLVALAGMGLCQFVGC